MKQYFDHVGLGKLIKTKRMIDLDIGLRELGGKLKISPSTLSRMENGKEAEINHILTVCNWLKVPISNLVKVKK